MKIIHIVFTLSPGGAERFVVSLSNSLVSMGHDVEICMLRNDSNKECIFNKQFLDANVKYHCMNFKKGFTLKMVRETEQYILSQKPDVVHCHLNVLPFIYRLALKEKSFRYIHTLHSVAQNTAGLKWQYYINQFFYKKEYILPVTISLLCQQSYRDFYHLDNSTYIDNGCADLRPTHEFEDTKYEIEQMKAGRNIPIFVHIGRYDNLKNQNLLIDSFNKLDQDGVDYILLVLGTDFDTEEAAPLREKSCSKIHYLGVKANVCDYLLCSDAFCLSSIYEGLPISLLEALSAGVTPICTAVGGIPDVITEGKTGYLSTKISVDSYVAALYRFLSKKLDSNVLKQHFKDNYSMDRCAEKYLMIYNTKRK